METKRPGNTTSGSPTSASEGAEPTKAGPPTDPKMAPGTDAASLRRAFVILFVLVAIAILVASIVGDDEEQPAPTASPIPSATTSASASAAPSAAPAAGGPGTPTDLQAEAGATEVRLTWGAPTDGSAVAGYIVSREGDVIATLGEDQFTYLDRDVQPVASYGYQVAAFDADGFGSPSPASVTARTTQVQTEAARLNGAFDVTLRVTSHFGYETLGDPPTDQRWTFAARCPEGICPVDVTVQGIQGASFRLMPNDAGYSGAFRTDSFVRCDGVPVTTLVKVNLSVASAASDGDVWTAKAIAGDVTTREAPQGACEASGIDFTAKGTAVG